MPSPKQAYKPSYGILQQLKNLKSSSPDFPNQLANLLSEQEYRHPFFLNVLHEEHRTWLVEYLDDVRVSFPLYPLSTERA